MREAKAASEAASEAATHTKTEIDSQAQRMRHEVRRTDTERCLIICVTLGLHFWLQFRTG